MIIENSNLNIENQQIKSFLIIYFCFLFDEQYKLILLLKKQSKTHHLKHKKHQTKLSILNFKYRNMFLFEMKILFFGKSTIFYI